MALIETMGKVELRCLILDRLYNLGVVVPRVATPQTTGSVDNPVALHGVIVNAISGPNEARVVFKPPRRGKWHPKAV